MAIYTNYFLNDLMAKQKVPAPYFDFRRKFSNQTQLHRFGLLAKEWGMSYPEVASKLIIDGLSRETKILEKTNEEKR